MADIIKCCAGRRLIKLADNHRSPSAEALISCTCKCNEARCIEKYDGNNRNKITLIARDTDKADRSPPKKIYFLFFWKPHSSENINETGCHHSWKELREHWCEKG